MDEKREKKMLGAIRTLNEEFGFSTISIYMPKTSEHDDNPLVKGFLMAPDEDTLRQACIDYLTPKQQH